MRSTRVANALAPSWPMIRSPFLLLSIYRLTKSAITQRSRSESRPNGHSLGLRQAAGTAVPTYHDRARMVGEPKAHHRGATPNQVGDTPLGQGHIHPAMIAARSSTPSIQRHPTISLQTPSPLHENCLHSMTQPPMTPQSASQSSVVSS